MPTPKPVDLEIIKETIADVFNNGEYAVTFNGGLDMSAISYLGDCAWADMEAVILLARDTMPAMITEIEYLRARVKELEDGRA